MNIVELNEALAVKNTRTTLTLLRISRNPAIPDEIRAKAREGLNDRVDLLVDLAREIAAGLYSGQPARQAA